MITMRAVMTEVEGEKDKEEKEEEEVVDVEGVEEVHSSLSLLN